MDTSKLKPGTLNRLKKIQELKKYTEEEALDFAISLGWLIAEQRSRRKIDS